jgi:hypothetical protein
MKTDDFLMIGAFIAIGFGLIQMIKANKTAGGIGAANLNPANEMIAGNPYTDLSQWYTNPNIDSTKGTIYL